MKLGWKLAAVAAALVAVLGARAHANLLAYDPFLVGDNPAAGQYVPGDEDAGTNLLGGDQNVGGQNPTIGPTAFYSGAWISHHDNSSAQSQAVKNIGSLNYFHFGPSQGGQQQETAQFSCCTFGRSARPIADVGFGDPGLGGGRDAKTIYESFLINWGTVGTNPPYDPNANPNPGGNEGVHNYEMWNGFNPANPDGSLTLALGFNYYAGDLNLRLQVQGQTQDLTGNLTRPALAISKPNGVHLVVLKYEFDPALPDKVSVYLDPTDSIESNWTQAASLSVAASDLLLTHQGAFSSFQFDGGGANPGAIDEVRWGDTFKDVTPFFVPEPSAFVLLALGALGLIAARRR